MNGFFYSMMIDPVMLSSHNVPLPELLISVNNVKANALEVIVDKIQSNFNVSFEILF